MKKLLFLIVSSAFILIVPNVVHAETTGIDFITRQANFGTGNGVEVNVRSSSSLNYGDSTLMFSFGANTANSVPYEVVVNMTNGEKYNCILSSVSSIAGTSNSMQTTISATCPVVYNVGVSILSLWFVRANTDGNIGNWITLPERAMLVKGLHFDSSAITNAQNGTTNAINGTTNAVNGVNDSINNDSVSTNTENSSTASSWASNNASDSVVSDMVLMPITLLNAFSSGFNGSCSPYNLGSLYGTNLTLPCINIQNYLGATLWGIIDVLMSGFLIYGIGKKFVRVFNDFTNLKDSQVDELYGGGNE